MEKRTLRVTGKGSLRLTPDMTRLTLTVTGKFAEYGEVLRHSSEDTEKLKDVLEALGFARESMKTLSFDVDPQYESYTDENHNYRQKFVGYVFRHVLKLEFASDSDLLGRTLYALGHSSVEPELQLSYFVKDQEKAKNELLGRAVEDAAQKAKVLAAAAGIVLKEILTIDYSWDELNFEVTPMFRSMSTGYGNAKMASASYDMNISPDDVEVSDTVTVVWEIG
ncbi:MAG: SIMPL domain-containing protein [Lachnospiraceae bacterium]|nr:SIMPL domain-containing protein [Lachnospiraceae bacterium]